MLVPLLALALAAAPADTPRVHVAAAPGRVFIERGTAQSLNFDFVLHNTGADTATVTRVELSVYDAAGRLQVRKLVNDNGPSPSILTLQPDRTLAPGAKGMLFNPFHELERDVSLAELRYEIEFRGQGDDDPPTSIAHVTVRPESYTPPVALSLPVQGRWLVWDGHDFYSHHRRWNWTHPVLAQNCFTSNPGRYSYDFALLGPGDSLHTGDGSSHAQWHGFGAAVHAPADGRVVVAAGQHADDGEFDISRLCADDLVMYGNVIVIDHGQGAMSVLAHLQQGSVTVRVGDEVRRGQPIARVGSSGSSLFPHLHYQLVTGMGHGAEGLPSPFTDVQIIRSGGWTAAPNGRIDSGDIVRAAP